MVTLATAGAALASSARHTTNTAFIEEAHQSPEQQTEKSAHLSAQDFELTMNLRQHSRHSTLLEDEITRVVWASAVAIDGENSFCNHTKVEQRRQQLGIDFTGVSGEQSKLLFTFIPAC
jgi:hypothetical protein